MEYAISLQNGRGYQATSVTHAKVRQLKLVCPVCNLPVFKRVRTIPETRHFFCHYKGGSPDCELYRSEQVHDSFGEPASTPQGQELAKFIADIRRNIQSIFINSKLVSEEPKLDKIEALLALVIQYEIETESGNVEKIAYEYVDDQYGMVNPETKRLLNVISGFRRNPQSRFMDEYFLAWVSYIICEIRPNIDSVQVLDVIIGDKERVEGLIGLMVSALLTFYEKKAISWVAAEFMPYQRTILQEIDSQSNIEDVEVEEPSLISSSGSMQKTEDDPNKKSPSKVNNNRSTLTPEDRYRMIETAAYFIAEQNGFVANFREYWKAAEAQIDAILKK